MKRLLQRKGQFIIIAALMVSIMIVSIGAILYGTVTYFRHERWEEYLSLIDTLKIGSHRVVEISLANYTLTMNSTILEDNLNKWKINLTKAYGGFGIVLKPELAQRGYQVDDLNISYSLGLNSTWNTKVSFSAANVTFSLNITSIGLHGYEFRTFVLLKLNITEPAFYYKSTDEVGIRLIIQRENSMPINNLQHSNFLEFNVEGENKNFTLSYFYDSENLNTFVYELRYFHGPSNSGQLSNVTISLADIRNIQVTGQVFNLTVIDA
jgi:hypothetical protein